MNFLKKYSPKKCNQFICNNKYVCTFIQVAMLVLLLTMSLNSQTYEEKYSVDVFLNSNPTTSTNVLIIKSPTGLGASLTFTLPPLVGSNGQYMMTDGTNSTTWNTETASSSPQGVDKAIQFNNANSFAGSASFTWDNSNTFLSIAVASSSYTLENYDVIRTGRDGSDGQLIFTSGSNSVYFIPNTSMTTTSNYNLPPDDGPSIKGLQTDGVGNLVWSGTVNYGPTGSGDLNDNTIDGGVTSGYIGGGDNNTISGSADNSSINGGDNNTVNGSAENSGIVGGNDSNIGGSASNSVVLGSDGSTINGSASNSGAIAGDDNTIGGSTSNSAIMGGIDANISGSASNSNIIAGDANNISGSASNSVVGGGTDNTILGSSSNSSVMGGDGNTLNSTSADSFIGGGDNNTSSGTSSAIVGGIDNTINSNSDRAIIGGGTANTINSDDSAIIGGINGDISSSENKITLFGGSANTTSGSGDSGILAGGTTNDIGNSDNTGIYGGSGHQMNSSGDRSLIAGGVDNTVSDVDVAIFAGRENQIRNSGDRSAILGGRENDLQDINTVILAGYLNVINNDNGSSAIVAGRSTQIQVQNSSMVYARTGDFKNGADYSLGGGYDVELENGSYQVGLGRRTNSQGAGTWTFGDGNTTYLRESTANSWSARFSGGFYLYTNSSSTYGITAASGDNDWTQVSDSSKKELKIKLNPLEILNKIKVLDISSWSYKDIQKGNNKRNYGPMAQDFYRLFGKDIYGNFSNEITIKGHDLSSIFILGVQGMKLKLEEHNSEIQLAKTKSKQIKTEIDKVAVKIDSIEEKINKINGFKKTKLK